MALTANFEIDQGSDHGISFRLRDEDNIPVDLTGFTGRSKMRKTYNASKSQDFTVIINAVSSSVNLLISAANTSKLEAGQYVYDVELISSSNLVTRIVEGIVTVTPQVTKNDP